MLSKSNLQFLNAALDCESIDTAEGWMDGHFGERLWHGLTFLLLCIRDGAPSDASLTKHWHQDKKNKSNECWDPSEVHKIIYNYTNERNWEGNNTCNLMIRHCFAFCHMKKRCVINRIHSYQFLLGKYQFSTNPCITHRVSSPLGKNKQLLREKSTF